MEFTDVLGFLRENHMAVVTTVGSLGRAQSTVVSAGEMNGTMVFVSRGGTVKINNIRKSARCTVTTIKLDTRRYVTVEGPAAVCGWDNTEEAELLRVLGDVYTAVGRPPSAWPDFNKSMRDEARTAVIVTPKRVYGSI